MRESAHRGARLSERRPASPAVARRRKVENGRRKGGRCVGCGCAPDDRQREPRRVARYAHDAEAANGSSLCGCACRGRPCIPAMRGPVCIECGHVIRGVSLASEAPLAGPPGATCLHPRERPSPAYPSVTRWACSAQPLAVRLRCRSARRSDRPRRSSAPSASPSRSHRRLARSGRKPSRRTLGRRRRGRCRRRSGSRPPRFPKRKIRR